MRVPLEGVSVLQLGKMINPRAIKLDTLSGISALPHIIQ
jgi:hypothetical protein